MSFLNPSLLAKTGTACGLVAIFLTAACVPTSTAAPGSKVPSGFSEKIGIPAKAVVSYTTQKGESTSVGEGTHLIFYEDMVSQEQLRAAPANICKQYNRRVATYEFLPTAQKPGAPATRKMRIVCYGL